MSLKVPYLADAAIEASANALLADYARRTRIDVRPPVPVEDILEDHLGLHLGFDDLRARLGVPDVLGALWIDDAEVTIDQTLDPGRASLGPQPLPLHPRRTRSATGTFIGALSWRNGCRTTCSRNPPAPRSSAGRASRREPIERQADAFAAALLMPRPEVAAHWQRLIGPERLEVSELRGRAGVFLAAALAGPSHEPRTQHDALIEFFIRPMAEAFEVSPQAMRIRLEQLGFIVHDIDTTMSMFEAV